MPKPIYGTAGSGMHTNMSLFKNGKNVFYDPNGDRQLSQEAYHHRRPAGPREGHGGGDQPPGELL